MTRRLAVVALALAALAATAGLQAQQTSPRDIWPQATAAARDGDFDTANKRTSELLTAARNYGIKTFPLYAVSAAGLASESEHQSAELAQWASETARRLDPASPAVAFNEVDRAARRGNWVSAARLSARGFMRLLGDYRTSVLSGADLVIVAAIAFIITAIILAISLFGRYARSAAHDFREWLGSWVRGGSVSVLAFALLVLPLFVWLGPMWLLLYWLAIFFGYASKVERAAIIALLLILAVIPLAVGATANRVVGVDSTVVNAAIASKDQSYQPEALRRLQDLVAVVPDLPAVHVLIGNMQSFEGAEDQAALHYRRAIELRPAYAGAHVNLGNLLFHNNEFTAAITEYEKAEKADPNLAIAFYNHSVASGETYRFDQQATMLDKARSADRSFVEALTRNPPPQKIVMYNPPIAEAWRITKGISRIPEARALFGNYSAFNPVRSAANPLTIGALVALLVGLLLWMVRRGLGFANECIKCGRTFCYRCKSARESSTYCTQCIHIYLKRDGVSLRTKRQKLEEVSDHLSGVQLRNRLFATFLPGSAQMLEGRLVSGAIAVFLFATFVTTAIFVGRLAPALGPSAVAAQLIIRTGAIAFAVVVWLFSSLPVYRRKVIA